MEEQRNIRAVDTAHLHGLVLQQWTKEQCPAQAHSVDAPTQAGSTNLHSASKETEAPPGDETV